MSQQRYCLLSLSNLSMCLANILIRRLAASMTCKPGLISDLKDFWGKKLKLTI